MTNLADPPLTIGSEFQVNTPAAGNQDNPAVSALADGGYVVAWESQGRTVATTGLPRQ